MPANLPYLPTPGSIKTALERIKSAATPERVTNDFIQTKLQIKGGTGASISAFMKKIGLVNSDATPSSLYNSFRNNQTSGAAIADAIKKGYRELYAVNEYCHELNDKELLSLICQVTGAASDSSVAKLTVLTFRNLRSFANFDQKQIELITPPSFDHKTLAPDTSPTNARLGLNLSYTINLNLPATADQAVFNAIFKSLKEHLLSEE